MNSDHQLAYITCYQVEVEDVKGNRTRPKTTSLTNHESYVLWTLLHFTREVERS